MYYLILRIKHFFKYKFAVRYILCSIKFVKHFIVYLFI